MDEQQEIIQEFLIESNENLTQLDQDFVELEQRPDDHGLLSSIFRTIHTIKGTCGFLGFSTLEAITHRAENILSQLRDGERKLTPELTTLLLETFDIVKQILARIEETNEEGDEQYEDLRDRLQTACDGGAAAPVAEVEPGAEAVAGQSERAEESSEPEETIEEPMEAIAEVVHEPTETSPASESSADDHQSPRSSIAESNIRVSVDLLDSLMNLVGELVLARNQILQYTETQEDAGFSATSQRLNLITTELQANVMKTRMQPIRVVWNKFPRVVRDLGQSFGKQIELQMEGADTELDKTIIEAIKDPLTHIVRNSCDHGIETAEDRARLGKPIRGRLLLRAYHEGGQVNIEITDDGAGIDTQKLKQKAIQKGLLPAERLERMSERELLDLIFMPGFSTAAKVTNVSGRGVGMDVVRTNIEKIGGSIDLQSALGQGATIKIKIPLTLAIIPALVVTCADERFAIPQVNLVELVRTEPGQEQQIESIKGSPVYRLRGKLLPLVYLNRVLGLSSEQTAPSDESVNIIVLQADEKTFGLVVDGVNDTAEIVVKPLSKLLKGMNCYAGATIMGDGHVALILDVMVLAQMGAVIGENRGHGHAAKEIQSETSGERQAVLLFRCGDNDRLAVPLSLVDRLEEFPRERIETSGEREVVQYREKILPLVPLNDYLGLGPSKPADADKAQVVVFSGGTKRVGIVVDEILDIVEEIITIRSRSNRAGVLGSAVIAGNVTDFIDLQYLIAESDRDWFGRNSKALEGARVLVAEGSPFSRGLMRHDLEMAGYRVVEAADSRQAVERLRSERVQVIVSSLDLPGGGPFDLLRRLRSEPGLERIPALGLSSTAEEPRLHSDQEFQFDDYQLKFDRAAMLQSIERLARAVAEHETVGAAN